MFIEPQNIRFSNTKAFFTTRAFVNDSENIAKEFNISKENIYLPVQRHTNRIHVLESDLKPVVADAVLTEKKGILIGVHVADCVPILLYDKQKSVVGAVHAGWRGAAKQILKKTIKAMQERFCSSVEDIFVAVGPSIRQCCYNVGDDVKAAVREATGEGNYYYKKDGKYFIDLSSAKIIQALSMGIPLQNIWQSEECTSCNPERFYSYRYLKNPAGRQGGFIGMW